MSFNFMKTHTARSYAARSDVGCVREHNEDSFIAEAPLFAVADGMGGHEAGEVASKIAINTLEQRAPKKFDPETLDAAVREANAAVIRGAKNGTGKPGMGTTMTTAMIFGNDVAVCQVGDSRAYLLHENKLSRITRDHSLIADLIEQGRLTELEARFHPQRSVITRALGSDPNMQADIYTLTVQDGDRIMLCSDGLSSMVPDETIEMVMVQNPNPNKACDALIEEALAAGGLDNVTVIVIDPLGDPEEEEAEDEFEQMRFDGVSDSGYIPKSASPEHAANMQPQAAATHTHKKKSKHSSPKEKRKGRFAPLIWAIVFVCILVAAGLGFYTYAQNSYYIIAEDGIVNVYRGLPGNIGGFSASWFEESYPEIDVKMLNPTTQSRLSNGISLNSLDEADQLIAEYRQTMSTTKSMQNTSSSSASTSAALSSSASTQNANTDAQTE